MYRSLCIFLVCFFCIVQVSAAEFTCVSPLKGQRFTQKSLDAILKPGLKKWPNLCGTDLQRLNLVNRKLSTLNLAGANMSRMQLSGVDLSYANLVKTYLRWATLTKAVLEGASIDDAVFDDAILQNASLRQARGAKASFSKADLQNVDLRATNLVNANFSYANLSGANLSWANLRGANFTGANLTGAILNNARLNHANLTHAKLTDATLTHAKLNHAALINTAIKNANFDHANFKATIFQPELGGKPKLIELASAKNLNSIILPNDKAIAALIELRSYYKKLGVRNMERTLTAAVKTSQMHRNWQSGGWQSLGAAASYVLFYITSDFGAKPSRALLLLIVFIILMAIPYRLSLWFKNRRHGIVVTWPSRHNYSLDKTSRTEQRQLLSQLLCQRSAVGVWSMVKEQWRCAKIALFFSLVSSVTIGWHDLNLSNFILRMQPRASMFRGIGWVRILTGLQSVVSAYLIVLWLFTYFGSPFEW